MLKFFWFSLSFPIYLCRCSNQYPSPKYVSEVAWGKGISLQVCCQNNVNSAPPVMPDNVEWPNLDGFLFLEIGGSFSVLITNGSWNVYVMKIKGFQNSIALPTTGKIMYCQLNLGSYYSSFVYLSFSFCLFNRLLKRISVSL